MERVGRNGSEGNILWFHVHTHTHTHTLTHSLTHPLFLSHTCTLTHSQAAQPLLQRATAPELSTQNHTPTSKHPQDADKSHRVVSRTQSESVTLEVAKRKDMASTRLKSETSVLRRPEVKNARTENRRSDQLASAEEVARRVVSDGLHCDTSVNITCIWVTCVSMTVIILCR